MNNLKKFRKSRKLTAKEAAKGIGISHQALYFWESSIHSPTPDNLKKLCKFYNVTSEEIFGVKKEKKENNPLVQAFIYGVFVGIPIGFMLCVLLIKISKHNP